MPAPAPMSAFGAPLSEPWKRLVAGLIDGVIISVVATILRLFVSSFFLSIFMWAIVLLVYLGVAHSQGKGQTVGMMALNIRVADNQTGANLDPGRSFARSGVMAALSLPCGIPLLIDWLSPLWDKNREAWHDKVAKSCVVDVPPS